MKILLQITLISSYLSSYASQSDNQITEKDITEDIISSITNQPTINNHTINVQSNNKQDTTRLGASYYYDSQRASRNKHYTCSDIVCCPCIMLVKICACCVNTCKK